MMLEKVEKQRGKGKSCCIWVQAFLLVVVPPDLITIVVTMAFHGSDAFKIRVCFNSPSTPLMTNLTAHLQLEHS